MPDVPALDEFAGEWVRGEILQQVPALSNFHGSLETSRNILGVQNFTIPPFAQGGEFARLSVNGIDLPAEEFRWFPFQAQRRTNYGSLAIVSTVRMPFEESGLLFRLSMVNKGSVPTHVTVSIDFYAAIRHYQGKWTWETRRPGDGESSDFVPVRHGIAEDSVFCTKDSQSESASAFLPSPWPDSISLEKRVATWFYHLKPGERVLLNGTFAVGPAIEEVANHSRNWMRQFSSVWEASRTHWEDRYRSAFSTEGNHFSGNLPILSTSDRSVRKLYYGSVISLLCLERTNLNPQFPRVFVTASPRWATTLVYFWDTSFFATVWALLDPVAMKEQLKLFVKSNIHACYAIDFMSLEPVGPWYSANDYSLFRLLATYISVTNDAGFLDEFVDGGKRVRDYLDEYSLFWKTLASPTSLLANYGDASNLLETVPSYTEYVPSLNAANVWMMRVMSRLHESSGETKQAKDLNEHADKLAMEVLGLYVKGSGFWTCLQADGERVEVRHCIDFFTTIDTIREDLGAPRIQEMIAFADRELWTPRWMRALSLQDPVAQIATRADHGSTGSYDAWPALTAESIFRVGRKAEAMQRWRDVELALREGPFGQSHYVATELFPVRKALSFGQDYFASASGCFAEVIVRTLFGFSPAMNEKWHPVPEKVPGFEGRLTKVRYGGKLLTVDVQAE